MAHQARRGDQISISEDFEIAYWTSRLGLQQDQLLDAVSRAGHHIDDVLALLAAERVLAQARQSAGASRR